MNLVFTLIFFTAAFIVFAWKKKELPAHEDAEATPDSHANPLRTQELHVDAVMPEPAFPLMKPAMQSVA